MTNPSEKDEGAYHRRFKVVFHGANGASWEGFVEIACLPNSKTSIGFPDLMVGVRRMERAVPTEERLQVLSCTITEPTSSEPDKPAFRLMRSSPVSPWYIETTKY